MHDMNRLMKRTLRTGWVGMVLMLTLLIGVTARAVTVEGLYEGNVRVPDSSEASRQKAFTDALSVVLTKLSGRRDAASKVGAAMKDAAKYVQRYGYVTGGRINVGFDPAAVNALLDQAGLQVWSGERPVVLVVYPLALQGMREAQSITEMLARQRGLPILWATTETSDAFPVNGLTQAQALAQRYGVEAVLLARGGTAANLNWQMVFNGASTESSGSAEEGPQLAADVLARYYAVNGQESASVILEVAGMAGVEAYGNTLNLLGKQLLVRSIAVESLNKDVLRLRLELRGTVQAFERAMAVDRNFTRDSESAADNAELRYRYNKLNGT